MPDATTEAEARATPSGPVVDGAQAAKLITGPAVATTTVATTTGLQAAAGGGGGPAGKSAVVVPAVGTAAARVKDEGEWVVCPMCPG